MAEGAAPTETCVQSKVFTREEVRAGSSFGGTCMIVIDEQVYDVTHFLKDHPGGDDVMLEYLGRDATIGFEDIGHSQSAKEDLKKFLVGTISNSS